MVQQVLQSIFLKKLEYQHKWINCKKTKYLDKLKEASKSKSGNKKLPRAYSLVKQTLFPHDGAYWLERGTYNLQSISATPRKKGLVRKTVMWIPVLKSHMIQL